jgi:hypothetical protein
MTRNMCGIDAAAFIHGGYALMLRYIAPSELNINNKDKIKNEKENAANPL